MTATASSTPFIERDLIRAAIDQAPDALILTDSTGAVRIWNQRAVEMFGFSMQEALDGGLNLIIPPDLRAAHWAGFRAAIAAGRTRSHGNAVVSRAMHKNGNKLYVELSFAVLRDGPGTTMGALAIARDVTQRHLAAKGRT